jgi:hypothetical protein
MVPSDSIPPGGRLKLFFTTGTLWQIFVQPPNLFIFTLNALLPKVQSPTLIKRYRYYRYTGYLQCMYMKSARNGYKVARNWEPGLAPSGTVIIACARKNHQRSAGCAPKP